MTEQQEAQALASKLVALTGKDGKVLFEGVRVKCDSCHGTGRKSYPRFGVPYDYYECPRCHGLGYTVSLSREDWEKAIEPYCEDGWRLTYNPHCPEEERYNFLIAYGSEADAPDPLLSLLRAVTKLAESLKGEKV